MFVLDQFLYSGAVIQESDTSWLVFWGDYSWEDKPDPNQPSLYAPDFFMKNQNQWLWFKNYKSFTSSELQQSLEGRKEGEKISLKQLQHQWEQMNSLTWNWKQPEKSDFAQEFQEIQQLFDSQKLEKAVPIVFAKSPIIPEDFVLKNLIHKLLLTAPGQHAYGFWTQEEGMLGISPEVLFEKNKNNLKTLALAGTAQDPQALIKDQKQLKEHHLVIEGIKESFNGHKLTTKETEAWSVGDFWHLKTPIQIELQTDLKFEQIVSKFHPTPALGGYPKSHFWDWAIENSQGKEQRMRFGAPFGVHLSSSESKVLVAIRNVQWNETEGLSVISGCGVVPESQLDSEWNELSLKRQAVFRMFGL
ncbi:MAG: chorismate-binding protein [Bdellovibrionales bacterium]|nr:chorismate-binding protein [Bdellovibrionales bacterium]